MNITEIREKYRAGDYSCKIHRPEYFPDTYVFDENLTVKRNREMIEEHNAEQRALVEASYNKQGELHKKLTSDVCCYITENYNISDRLASKIQQFCYSQKHHDMYAYFDYIDTIAEFVDSILD